MPMKRSPIPLAVALVLAGAAAASSQEFSGMDGLASRFSGLRAQIRAQEAVPQKPVQSWDAPRETPMHAMGGEDRLKLTTLDLLSFAAIPNVGTYQVRGIDISHYQGAIDWSKVKAGGLSFVYIKATEGADGVDDHFAANWRGAADAGLSRGAYHFYNFCKTGAEQAANFVAQVPADADALPATIDLEESGDCGTMPDKAAFRKDLADFVAKVKAAYGHTPILYVNYSIYDKYFSGDNGSYRLWIADTGHESPSLPDSASWMMWQYGWHGAVDGIAGEVDLDVFNGTPEMLAALPADTSVMVASLGPDMR